jgi:3D (Asp-Asp-Asp) domain-containing protein
MEALRKNHNRIFDLKLAKRILIVLIFVLIFDFFLFPTPVIASEFDAINHLIEEVDFEAEKAEILEQVLNYQNNFVNRLPENNTWKTERYSYHAITAYTSEVGQCDGSPCITANGFNLCEHGMEDSIAANWLKFGTKVRIPDLYGDHVFVVRDRMNARYASRVDIWMKDKQEAKKFGIKVVKIEILE